MRRPLFDEQVEGVFSYSSAKVTKIIDRVSAYSTSCFTTSLLAPNLLVLRPETLGDPDCKKREKLRT